MVQQAETSKKSKKNTLLLLSLAHSSNDMCWMMIPLLLPLIREQLHLTYTQSGLLPTRNFQTGYLKNAENISGKKMSDTILIKREACYAYSVRCKRVVQTKEPYEVDPTYGGPEYETLDMLGANCDIDDLVAVCKGNEFCNKYGLDTISTGASIAFAMECYENGIIAKEDTGGVDLKFGNADAMVKMVEMIAKREKIGDTLAEGVKRAAEKIGKGSEKFAIHVKGEELPAHDPRVKGHITLMYPLSPVGADHMQAEHDSAFTPGTPDFFFYEKDRTIRYSRAS